MTEPVREPKLIAPTRHIHAIWESNNPVVPEGVLCITKDRLYTGSVEYFIGDGTNPYTMLPKFGMNSQEGTASDTVAGMIELATPEEVLAGTDTERGITPATLTAKILGTVSEVDGVPTGAVIESGSNANGNYVKFADGTMICTGGGTLAYANASVLNKAVTFAAEYINMNYSPSMLTSVPAAWHRESTLTFNNFATTGVTLGIIDNTTTYSSGDTLGFTYTIIGRWY